MYVQIANNWPFFLNLSILEIHKKFDFIVDPLKKESPKMKIELKSTHNIQYYPVETKQNWLPFQRNQSGVMVHRTLPQICRPLITVYSPTHNVHRSPVTMPSAHRAHAFRAFFLRHILRLNEIALRCKNNMCASKRMRVKKGMPKNETISGVRPREPKMDMEKKKKKKRSVS